MGVERDDIDEAVTPMYENTKPLACIVCGEPVHYTSLSYCRRCELSLREDRLRRETEGT